MILCCGHVSCCSLYWRHNEHDGVSNQWRADCLLNRLSRRRSKKTSKLRVTGLCEGNSPLTGEFPAQMASNAENVSIWWRRHVIKLLIIQTYTLHQDTVPHMQRICSNPVTFKHNIVGHDSGHATDMIIFDKWNRHTNFTNVGSSNLYTCLLIISPWTKRLPFRRRHL